MEETISLREIFDILKQRYAMILTSMFAGLALAAIVTFFIMTPQYSSRAQMIVALPQDEGTDENLNTVNYNLQMLNTYKDIIEEGDALASTVQDRLASEYDLEMTIREIKDSMEVEQSEESQMFSIVATGETAADAEHIANTAAEVFQDTVQDVLTNVDKITIVSRATASNRPVSPNNTLNLAIGLILGLLVGIALAFLREVLDRTVKDSRYVTDTLGLTVLGNVPKMSQKEIEATTQKLRDTQRSDDQDNNTSSGGRRSRTRV
ncbi:Wzz/FepE/Etk N-terminal domain-containing protein [Tetragenococcus koreensis]|uniref:YveK family protein n=1 Tax=Tetragenococcus koreensis TaxID=290335 RepID=UPI000F50188A|nr:Wzz/FepE/Etk N-terminal domain-containing protein [Tetragenococcus koreensis]AYW46460.1 tyrosine protein kinase [Tetragenococcus koreensis]MCF1585827.1 Wzz/FepE/Etk N-terminal domain-containing protein [Tetragenococcus koreensis]MCF1627495.1 Wzz/FepE/Etk N-terminal domain-containing protein [Tetragenococcus koreensis]MCF1630075.1 Wzz/FepE/Etk N-terminal domain-containing protein [Tetragenococcus koreensis]GEN91990.1 tyrosine protein kinase [Tetragenococcus koreensis]